MQLDLGWGWAGDGLGCAWCGNLRAGLGIFGGMGVVRETGWKGVWIEWCL